MCDFSQLTSGPIEPPALLLTEKHSRRAQFGGPLLPRQDPSFQTTVSEVRAAISADVLPRLIPQGSSGSYFCSSRDNVKIGVFKPRDEEPYGDSNPKLPKRIQRTLFPCMFGRSCLLSNIGFISEAAASVVDRLTGLDIVPLTGLAEFYSSTFSYKKSDTNRRAKIGSLQLFVLGGMSGTDFIRQIRRPLPPSRSRTATAPDNALSSPRGATPRGARTITSVSSADVDESSGRQLGSSRAFLPSYTAGTARSAC